MSSKNEVDQCPLLPGEDFSPDLWNWYQKPMPLTHTDCSTGEQLHSDTKLGTLKPALSLRSICPCNGKQRKYFELCLIRLRICTVWEKKLNYGHINIENSSMWRGNGDGGEGERRITRVTFQHGFVASWSQWKITTVRLSGYLLKRKLKSGNGDSILID